MIPIWSAWIIISECNKTLPPWQGWKVAKKFHSCIFIDCENGPILGCWKINCYFQMIFVKNFFTYLFSNKMFFICLFMFWQIHIIICGHVFVTAILKRQKSWQDDVFWPLWALRLSGDKIRILHDWFGISLTLLQKGSKQPFFSCFFYSFTFLLVVSEWSWRKNISIAWYHPIRNFFLGAFSLLLLVVNRYNALWVLKWKK